MAFYDDDDLERLDDDELEDLDEPESLDDEPESLDDDDELDMDDGEELGDGDELPPPEPMPEHPKLNVQKVNKLGMKLNVDVTVVIDVTGSMENMIEAIKRDVTNFRTLVFEKLSQNLQKKRQDRALNKMRVRVVAYRDYNYDWEAAQQPKHGPMLQSCFYDLDDETEREALQNFVNQLEATGGEDAPESALEALHYAINSDWDFSEGVAHRQVIMLFTDAPGLPLEDERNATNPHYPTDANMPKSLIELQAEYNDKHVINPSAQRLLIFAPVDCYPWNEISEWNAATVSNVIPDSGLSEVAIGTIIAALTGSL